MHFRTNIYQTTSFTSTRVYCVEVLKVKYLNNQYNTNELAHFFSFFLRQTVLLVFVQLGLQVVNAKLISTTVHHIPV